MNVATPAARLPKFLMIAAALLMGARIVSFAVADRLGVSDPEFALAFDASHPRAHLERAEEFLAADPPDLQAARAEAIAALTSDPLSARALQRLARMAESQGDPERTERLAEATAAASSRELFAHTWLLDRDLRARKWDAAMDRLDRIFRGHSPQVWEAIATVLAPVLTDPQVAEPLVQRLSAQPRWRPWLLKSLAAKTEDLEGLGSLYAALRASPAPPDRDEMRPFLTRLVGERRIEEAYLVWLQSLPTERLSEAGHLYNARFEHDVSNLPFDWQFQPITGAVVDLINGDEGAGRTLTVDFFGARVPFRHVSHLLVLPPGDYRLSGRESAEGLRNDRGLRWRIFCLDEPNGALGQTDALTGDAPWREFTVEFVVPETCAAQMLQLELPARVAREQEISGGVRYKELSIRKM